MSKKLIRHRACSIRFFGNVCFVQEVVLIVASFVQVHKMVAISQLPPDIRLQARAAIDRTVRSLLISAHSKTFTRVLHQVIEQYKRQIFDLRGGSGGQSLKEELIKLLRRVDERIPHSLGQDMTFVLSLPAYSFMTYCAL
jgi:hypothetical protein